MSRLIFAANWKMHLGPEAASEFLTAFLDAYEAVPGREVWWFPSAIAVPTVAAAVRGRDDMRVGAQHVYWEASGAFTGELSVGMAVEAGASTALVGHSERRHVFGETVEDTARKVRALLEGGCVPVLCVGEQLAEREAGRTWAVVEAQLEALADLTPEERRRVVVAYEPVWAIGTGKTATPADAADVHGQIHAWCADRGAADVPVLYGGSVKPANAGALLAQPGVDGVLVGGASLVPEQWTAIVQATIEAN